MSAREIASLERDAAILDLIGKLDRLDTHRGEQITALHTELAEIRDDMVALSHRIEAVTRTVGGGLHSVPTPPADISLGRCPHGALTAYCTTCRS